MGNPEHRILHGGCITTLIDSAFGYALFAWGDGQLPDIATLDLRIDYLKPAKPDLDVVATAEVYRVTNSIAFLRAEACQTEGDPIANAVATFMMGRTGRSMRPEEFRHEHHRRRRRGPQVRRLSVRSSTASPTCGSLA